MPFRLFTNSVLHQLLNYLNPSDYKLTSLLGSQEILLQNSLLSEINTDTFHTTG